MKSKAWGEDNLICKKQLGPLKLLLPVYSCCEFLFVETVEVALEWITSNIHGKSWIEENYEEIKWRLRPETNGEKKSRDEVNLPLGFIGSEEHRFRCDFMTDKKCDDDSIQINL